MLFTCNTIMDPTAIAARVLVVYAFFCIFLKLPINGFNLFIRSSHHNRKGMIFGENIAYEFVFLSVSNSPAISIAILRCIQSLSS